jgi:hypothetical protein
MEWVPHFPPGASAKICIPIFLQVSNEDASNETVSADHGRFSGGDFSAVRG